MPTDDEVRTLLDGTTPGPWKVINDGETIAIGPQEGGRLAMLTMLRGQYGLGGRRDPREVSANAALIAAAPALAAALRAANERGPQTAAASDVLAERRRQIEVEGWNAQHDDWEHEADTLAMAAACYATPDGAREYSRDGAPVSWPWDPGWWKPKDRRRDLVRAAALLIAEIERIDRAALGEPR